MTRYITGGVSANINPTNPTPIAAAMEDPERYRLYRLCPCEDCGGRGKLNRDQALAVAERLGRKVTEHFTSGVTIRCPSCRGEGRALDLVATCGTPEAVGVALVTLTSEGEFEECPFGLMDRPQGETGKWLLLPWGPSARNLSDAGKTLRSARRT